MLRLQNLNVRRGSKLLATIDAFEAEPGEVIGVVGRSGAGKTTLLEALAGALPGDGYIFLDQASLEDATRRNMALRTIQNFPLFHWLTAHELIELALSFRPGTHDTPAAALKSVEAEHLAGRYPLEMSGGERARVTLAIAWALNVRLLLLDEPFNGLDPLTRVTIGTKLFARFRERSTIVFFVTHNLDDIRWHLRCMD